MDTIWRKSSYSQPSDSQCVEARVGGPNTVAVRDSKDPTGPQLHFNASAWSAFIGFLAVSPES